MSEGAPPDAECRVPGAEGVAHSCPLMFIIIETEGKEKNGMRFFSDSASIKLRKTDGNCVSVEADKKWRTK